MKVKPGTAVVGAIVVMMIFAMLHAFSRGIGYGFARMLFHHFR